MAVDYLLQGDGASKITLGDGSGFLILGSSTGVEITAAELTTGPWSKLMTATRLDEVNPSISYETLNPVAAYHEARKRG